MVTDGQGGSSAAATLNLTFVPENDAPDLTVVTSTVEWTGIRYNGDNPATVKSFSKILQPTLNLTDRDDVTLANATVVILNGQVGPGGYPWPRHPVEDRDASACMWRHLAFTLARPRVILPCNALWTLAS
jgi:hypothetical protein